MKFFDLELGSSLATATKKKGGTRDVYFYLVGDHCYGTYTTSSGSSTHFSQICNLEGEWHVFTNLVQDLKDCKQNR